MARFLDKFVGLADKSGAWPGAVVPRCAPGMDGTLFGLHAGGAEPVSLALALYPGL